MSKIDQWLWQPARKRRNGHFCMRRSAIRQQEFERMKRTRKTRQDVVLPVNELIHSPSPSAAPKGTGIRCGAVFLLQRSTQFVSPRPDRHVNSLYETRDAEGWQ
jgi:hypothetical protein